VSDAPFIMLAPFANERMREWPADNFRRFIELALQDGKKIVVTGTKTQRMLANEIVRPFPAGSVRNMCGRLSWAELNTLLSRAYCVVANNSGVAHLAAVAGTWTLCVFGAKHAWIEWMPRGPRVILLARGPACSPCEAGLCPNGLVCLTQLDAEFAYLEMSNTISAATGRNVTTAAPQ
jgi:ADP-heptose:LPS heptosyltransferase